MPNPRRSLFGTPTRAPIPSKITEELVPLVGGLHTDVPGILLDTASSASMQNFLPLDGHLEPRSRLSSIGTVVLTNASGAQQVTGIMEYTTVTGTPILWTSGGTLHATWNTASNATGFSLASFVSAGGIGSLATVYPQGTAGQGWDYAVIYSATNNNMVLAMAAQSFDTILAGDASGTPIVYSYLTQAPRAKAVAVFDNYLLAWNTWEGGASVASSHFPQRVRWSDRGDPNNWTTGISGFEDLLAMPGSGTKITSQDNRLILFTDASMWQGFEAAYPAQFQFQPLEPEVGCPYPRTVAHTPDGLIFMDQATNLRLLPKIWGVSKIISGAVREILQANIWPPDKDPISGGLESTWGWYDPTLRTYWLGVKCNDLKIRLFSVGLGASQAYGPAPTGVWASHQLADFIGEPTGGTYVSRPGVTASASLAATTIIGDGLGQVYSMSSTVNLEQSGGFGSIPTSTWKSKPLGGEYPGQEKTVTEIRFDYKATSRSTATVHISLDNGNTFVGTGAAVSLAPTSFVSQAIAHVYGSGRYPMIRWQSESTGYQLHRCHAVYRLGGR